MSWHPDGEAYEDYPWELYHLDEDPTESNDLAARMPEKVAELERAFAAAAERYDVLPLDDRWFSERAEFTSPEPMQFSFAAGAGPLNALAEAPRLAMRSWSITLGSRDPGATRACWSPWETSTRGTRSTCKTTARTSP